MNVHSSIMFKVLVFFSSFLEKVILMPIAFELYPLYHYKQTSKQKQTKQNKTKNKNKNKLPSFGVNTPNIVCKILFFCMQILQRIIFTFHTAVISPFVYINRFWRKHCEQKISFRLLEWTPLTLFVKSYFCACRFYKELSLLFIQQSYLRLFTLTGSEGNTAPMASSPIHVTSTWTWHWRRRL